MTEQGGFQQMQSEQKIRIADIKIYPCFQETPPVEHVRTFGKGYSVRYWNISSAILQ